MIKNKDKILDVLAQILGADKDDFGLSDSFVDDLHMNTVELADLAQQLEDLGYNISPEDMSNIDTISDLLETIDDGDF